MATCVPGFDLVQQSPQQHRYAGDVLETQNRMVVVPVSSNPSVVRMRSVGVIAAVEQLRRAHRLAVPTKHLEIDIDLRVWLEFASSSIRMVPDAVRTSVSPDAVPHGGWRIAVDGAEVSLAVDQQVARREVLGETRQRVVDRLGRRAGGTSSSRHRRGPRSCGTVVGTQAGLERGVTGCVGAPASARRARREERGETMTDIAYSRNECWTSSSIVTSSMLPLVGSSGSLSWNGSSAPWPPSRCLGNERLWRCAG